MTFDEVLSILVGCLGEEIQLTLGGAEGEAPTTMAAELTGTLRAADELDGRQSPADSLLFVLDSKDGEEVANFVLSKKAFRGADWFDENEEVLAITSGVIRFLITSKATANLSIVPSRGSRWPRSNRPISVECMRLRSASSRRPSPLSGSGGRERAIGAELTLPNARSLV